MSTDPLPGGAPVGSIRCLDDASYVLGALSLAERKVFEQHLATCPACQTSVARLAGLPGLLALTSEADVDDDQSPVPDTLLPRLLTVTARDRRRRRWIWTGTMVAAAACVVALAVVIAIRPASSRSVPLPAPVAMTQVLAGPMTASLQLTDKQWGTDIVINCRYNGVHDPGANYQLVIFDKTGKGQSLSWWKSVSGTTSTIPAATSLRLDEISHLEVQLPDGRPVLSAVPRHG